MMRLIIKKTIQSIILLLTLLLSGIYVYAAENADVQKLMDLQSYREYLQQHSGKTDGADFISIRAADYFTSNGDVKIYNDYEGMAGESLYMTDEGITEWQFKVESSGLYNIEMLYFPVEGKGNTIERMVTIDGVIPYEQAKYIYFSRIWADAEGAHRDGNDNDIRPAQEEKPEWRKTFLHDSLGYFSEPLVIYLEKGTHTIGLESLREPLVLNAINIYKSEPVKTYAEALKEYEQKGYQEVKGEAIKFQAENAHRKSSFTIYPVSDRSSAATEPQDISKVRLNTIGGANWKMPREWVTWKFNVEEDGLYKIAVKYKQNLLTGMYVNRKFLIDGELPFQEASNIKFNYSSEWEIKTLGDDETEFLFYLTKGEHEIMMEVGLGDLADVLERVNECLYQLNDIYRKILMLTGSEPDLYRDYSFSRRIPAVIEEMNVQSQVLKDVSASMEAYVGEKGEQMVILDRISYQLDTMYDDPEAIAKTFQSFKDNIGALGTWILTVGEQPLMIDYIMATPPEKKLPKAEAGLFQALFFEMRSFVMSFFVDYNSLGSALTSAELSNADPVTVWLNTGRDQTQILREMINDTFTASTGISVDLKLVSADTLLPSVLAGIGPDVSLGNLQGDPIQYAVRNGVINIDQFSDYDEIAKRFPKSAITPFEFDGKVYAIPETLDFPMMFYRMDIFMDLGLSVPTTWDEFYRLIPELQKNNLQVGCTPGIGGVQIFMYQKGAELYNNERTMALLDANATMDAFQQMTELFTTYKLPRDYDFANRFRTGEMPIGISNYTTYNKLIAFAPEIKGMWEFVPLPATVLDDGTLSYSSPTVSTGAMILRGAKDPEKSWEFLKWWTNAESQSRFAREMEAVLGQAAKQASANEEAIEGMSWTASEYRNLMSQWKDLVGTPEIPGGYYVSRAFDFASAAAYINGDSEILLDHVISTNEEIARKRIEFGFDQ